MEETQLATGAPDPQVSGPVWVNVQGELAGVEVAVPTLQIVFSTSSNARPSGDVASTVQLPGDLDTLVEQVRDVVR